MSEPAGDDARWGQSSAQARGSAQGRGSAQPRAFHGGSGAKTPSATRSPGAAAAPPAQAGGPRTKGPSDIRPRPGRIPGLDGIRALAILGVLVYHFTPAVLPGGFLGVDVFFVVSGFLITTILLREISKRGKINLPQFWLRRARRLVPALVTVVLVSVAAAFIVGGDLLVAIERQALGALTFSTNWLEINAEASYFDATSPLLFINFWSLAVEEQFYLVWPLVLVVLLALARTTRARLWATGTFAAASAVWMAVLWTPGADSTRIYYGTDTHLFGLMLGAGLAFAWASPQRAGLRTRGWRRWRGLSVLASLAVLVALMATLSEDSAWTFRGGILLACLATVILIAGLLESGGPWRSLMQVPPMTWLGQRSYGIYLWHWPVLMVAAQLFPFAAGTTRAWIVLGCALTLTLALAQASHHFIESPIRNEGFLVSLRRLGAWIATPWDVSRLPRTVATAVLGIVAMASVAVATAPDKSETQQVIEATEAELSGGSNQTPLMQATEGMAGVRQSVDAAIPWLTPSTAPGSADGEGSDSESGAGSSNGDGKDDSGSASGNNTKTNETKANDTETSDKNDDAREAGQDLPAGVPSSFVVDEDGLAVPHGEDITAIGDSLVVTSADGLSYRFPGMNFEAKSNRQWGDAESVIEDALSNDRIQDNVILHFGTNAGVQEGPLRDALDALGPDRRVVLMTVYSSSTFIPESNKIINDVASDYDNVVVGQWAKTITDQLEALQSDQVHPDIEGMHVYAQVVAEAFDALVRE